MKFCGHVPNSYKNKNVKRLIPHVPPKMVFLDSKTLLSSLNTWVKNEGHFEHYEVKNEYLRFGGHVDIQAKYKILWLELRSIKKMSRFYRIYPTFSRGFFWQFSWKTTLNVQGLTYFQTKYSNSIHLHIYMILHPIIHQIIYFFNYKILHHSLILEGCTKYCCDTKKEPSNIQMNCVQILYTNNFIAFLTCGRGIANQQILSTPNASINIYIHVYSCKMLFSSTYSFSISKTKSNWFSIYAIKRSISCFHKHWEFKMLNISTLYKALYMEFKNIYNPLNIKFN